MASDRPVDAVSFVVDGEIPFRIGTTYELVKKLGSGAYGCVISARRKDSGTKLAIKRIYPISENKQDAKHIMREVRLMRFLGRHANIIGLKDVIVHPQHDEAYLIMELMDTDMHRVIQSSQELTDAHFKHIMYQILSGLRYAHRSGVMHRDLKPANILLDRATNAKLADFGLSRAVDADVDLFTADAATLTTMTAHVVTRWYRAPELMLSADGHYSAAVDIWSVGCILAELLLRKPLWPGNDFMDQLTRIFATTGKPSAAELDYVRSQQALDFVARLPDTPKTEWASLFPHANPKCLDLLDKMLTFHPKKRINVEDAMNHPYFDSVRGQYEDVEPELPPEFNFDFEKDESLTLSDYRQMIVEEAVAFKKERMEMARLRRERRGK